MLLRLLFSCSQRATSSFPVPFEPVTSTRASVGATLPIISFIFTMAGDSPTIWGMPATFSTFFLRILVSFTKEVLSVAFFRVISILFRSRGFCMKSNAPFFMQSTAVSMDPWPEIITTAASTPFSISFSSISTPSITGIFISEKITS